MTTVDSIQEVLASEPVADPPSGKQEKEASIKQDMVDNKTVVNMEVESEVKVDKEVKSVAENKESKPKIEVVNNGKVISNPNIGQNDNKGPESSIKKGSREDKNSRRKDERSVDQIMRSVSGIESPQEKLSAVCKKYADSVEDNRKLQAQMKNMERKLAQVERERDAAQGEYSKAVLTRSRLEGLCRELQRQNKAIKDESLLRIREEEEKRKEVSNKFQVTLSEINSLMQQNNDKNLKLRDDNIEMTAKFKSVCEQYELRVQQVEKISKQMQLEAQLADAKLAKARMEAAADRESLLREKQNLLMELAQYQQRCQEHQETEVNLRSQIELYTSKYDEFQSALSRSNQVFGGFKGEMDKMSKKIVKLEKETSTWKLRWEKSHQALLEMATDKQQRDAELALATRQLTQLHKLCRTLTEERAKLMAQINSQGATLDTEKQEKQAADLAEDRRKLNDTLDNLQAVLAERERLHQLQLLEKQQQELQKKLLQRMAPTQTEGDEKQQQELHKKLLQRMAPTQTEGESSTVAPAQQQTTKPNEKKKGKKGKNGRQNKEKSLSPVSSLNASEEIATHNQDSSFVEDKCINELNAKQKTEPSSSSPQEGLSLPKLEGTLQPKLASEDTKAQTSPVNPETAPIKAELTPVKAEIPLVKAETTPVKAETPPVEAETPPVKEHIAPAKVGTPLIKAEAPPAQLEAPLLKAKIPPPKAETQTGKLQSSPIQAASISPDPKTTQPKAETSPPKVPSTEIISLPKTEPTSANIQSVSPQAEAAVPVAKVELSLNKVVPSPVVAECKVEDVPVKTEVPPKTMSVSPQIVQETKGDRVVKPAVVDKSVKSTTSTTVPTPAPAAFSYAAALGCKPTEIHSGENVPKPEKTEENSVENSIGKTVDLKHENKLEKTEVVSLELTSIPQVSSGENCDVAATELASMPETAPGTAPSFNNVQITPAVEPPVEAINTPPATSPQSKKGKLFTDSVRPVRCLDVSGISSIFLGIEYNIFSHDTDIGYRVSSKHVENIIYGQPTVCTCKIQSEKPNNAKVI